MDLYDDDYQSAVCVGLLIQGPTQLNTGLIRPKNRVRHRVDIRVILTVGRP